MFYINTKIIPNCFIRKYQPISLQLSTLLEYFSIVYSGLISRGENFEVLRICSILKISTKKIFRDFTEGIIMELSGEMALSLYGTINVLLKSS